MPAQRRLIVCLDGTWNQQDSSTNVLHHFNLVREGPDSKIGVVQTKYYHAGVGTGVLDGITGGGLGFGLEKNVRDAYNWLVQNYNDSGPGQPDEIYIYGFSRGAYTARSLVGFISECGLLRRGAPITVSQLWQTYCILGRNKEERKSMWDGLFKRPKAAVRPIAELAVDPWLTDVPGVADRVAEDHNTCEDLLVAWSRRAKITYLGIYDTVGAIGWDALAIPGLRSRIALHNNMRPTTIIQHCRHGLAIDEHRSSFSHTPFRAFVGHRKSDAEIQRAAATTATLTKQPTQAGWADDHAMWHAKIEQRWFVGAHSNVGGGYEDNRLAANPLKWIIDGGIALGLDTEQMQSTAHPTFGQQCPRDSFAEFVPPLWTKVIRAKPNYRPIDPEPLPCATAIASAQTDPSSGFSLQSINECLDPSVIQYWKDANQPAPPNLYEYLSRPGKPKTPLMKPVHNWQGNKLRNHVATVAWASFAAAGFASLCELIGLDITTFAHRLTIYLAALFLPLIDWGESRQTFKQALAHRPLPRGRAFLDSIYWMRASATVLFILGVSNAIRYMALMGWHSSYNLALDVAALYWPVPCLAALAILVVDRSKGAWLTLILGPAATLGSAAALFLSFRLAGILFGATELSTLPPPEPSKAGYLILLQLALIYLYRSAVWNGEPMSLANLSSVAALQICFTPDQVKRQLERWRKMLECCSITDNPRTGPAALRMRELVRECLWRDVLGYIPVYAGFLVFGLWFAARYSVLSDILNWKVAGLALWTCVPLAAAAADYLEDVCHFRYIRLHEQGKNPSFVLTAFSTLMSGIKWIGVITGLAGVLVGMAQASWSLTSNPTELRAKVAILISVAIVVILAMVLISAPIVRFFNKEAEGHQGSIALTKSAAAGK